MTNGIYTKENNKVFYTQLYDWNFLNNFDDEQYKVLAQTQLNVENNDFEVNVSEIIEKFHIKMEEEPMDGTSGKTVKGVIKINKNENPRRKRFSMAHELGHVILQSPSKDETFYRFMDSKNYETLEKKIDEREANEFAADLLMPKKLVEYAINYISKNNDNELDDKELVNEIKDLMNVSYTSMGYRLKNLGFIGDFNVL